MDIHDGVLRSWRQGEWDTAFSGGETSTRCARITWLTLGNTAVSIVTRGEALSCEQRNGQAHLV